MGNTKVLTQELHWLKRKVKGAIYVKQRPWRETRDTTYNQQTNYPIICVIIVVRLLFKSLCPSLKGGLSEILPFTMLFFYVKMHNVCII